jgi:hypothetical protein
MRVIDYLLWMDDAETVFIDTTDFHADAFIAATGITDATIKNAIRYRVEAKKKAGTWYKTFADYPFVGGTASTHKFNLKDASDTDEAFRLTYHTSGVTHSSNGVDFSNGWADTWLIPRDVLQAGNTCFQIYINEDVAFNGAIMGVFEGTEYSIWPRRTTTNALRFVSEEHPGTTDFANTNAIGFYQMNRTTADYFLWKGYKNGTNVFTATGGSAGGPDNILPAYSIILGGRNNSGTKGTFGAHRVASFSISRGMSDIELAADRLIDMNFQKMLGRYL